MLCEQESYNISTSNSNQLLPESEKPHVFAQPLWKHPLGGWLPDEKKSIPDFLIHLHSKNRQKDDLNPLIPQVQKLKDLIENDPSILTITNMMITEAMIKYQSKHEKGLVILKDYNEMCDLINEAVLHPPPFNDTGLVAFPINAIFAYSMATSAGFAFFASEKVNATLREILQYYGEYLSSESSLVAFKPVSEGGGGWMSDEAVEKLGMSRYRVPDPRKLGWGYPSWNQWFIRQFKEEIRPVHLPDDPKIICNSCESTPYSLQSGLKLYDKFWLKGQPYSLSFMLGGAHHASPFVGGCIYQAFLSAFDYHRWHAPVDGTIEEAYVIPGTYYAQCPAVGFDPSGPDMSQSFITNLASRAVIKVRADNASIGLMCFVAVGMAEVSSNIINVSVGDTVKKGDELGYFLFGGSTHCLLFRKGVIKKWFLETAPKEDASVIKLNSRIAMTW